MNFDPGGYPGFLCYGWGGLLEVHYAFIRMKKILLAV